MSVKIRLQRHGKKGKPFYWIVAADARAKRDGKYLEKLGTYNPNTNPAQITLDIDGTVTWLQNGAQPTDTARAILSYKGAMLKNHLAGGVRKGALTEDQAEEKFNAWLDEKEGKIDTKKEDLAKADAATKTKALEAEKEVNAKRLADADAALKAEEEAKVAAEAEAVAAKEAEEAKSTEAPATEETTTEGETPVAEGSEEETKATPEAEVVATKKTEKSEVTEVPAIEETTTEEEKPAAEGSEEEAKA